MKYIYCVIVCTVSFIFPMEQSGQVSKKLTKQAFLADMQEVLESGSLIALDEQKEKVQGYILQVKKEEVLLFFREQIRLLEVRREKEREIIAQEIEKALAQEIVSSNCFEENYELSENELEEEWHIVSVEKE